MNSNWPSKKISEIAHYLNNKRIPLKSLDRAKRQGPYPYYGASGIVDSIDDYIFDGIYLLISEDGENLRTRKTPIAFKANGKFWVNNHAHILSEKEEGVLDYLEYYFSALDLNAYITGAAQPKLNKANLDSIDISYPDKENRLFINSILNSLTCKIELNQQINQTLEQMAQALFKSWFVDFEPVKAKIAVLEAGGSQDESTLAAMTTISGKDADSLAIFEQEQPEKFAELKATAELFPSAMQDSELGGIPKDWCIKTYDQFCDFVQSGGTPKRSEPAYWENGCIKWLSSGEVRGKIVLDTKEKITNAGLNNSSAKLWPKHSTVMAMYGATAGEICLLAEDMSANQACCALHSINSPFFTYFSLCNISTEISSKASGSAQQNLNKGIISETKICIPNDNILSDYENKIHSIMMAWISNVKLSRELSVLRNTLLPKLLSGEITLPEAEQAVSEAENV